MSPDLLRPLLEHPEVRGVLGPPARRMVMSASSSVDRVNLLLFACDEPAPSLFAKVSGDPAIRAGLRREHEALQAVHKTFSDDDSVPRPVALVEEAGWTCLVQSTVPGTSMEVSLSRRLPFSAPRVRDIGPVLGWLGRLQTATRAGSRPLVDAGALRSRLADLVPTPLPGRVTRVLALGERLGERPVEAVTSHGDLWPGNVLLHRGAVGVVDWEESSPGQLPTDDVIMFLSTYAFMLRRRRSGADDQVRAFAEAWLGSGRIARLCTAALRSFVRARGLGPDELDVLLVQFLADRCVHPVGPTAEQWREMLRAYVAGRPAILDAPPATW